MPKCSCETDNKFSGQTAEFKSVLWVIIAINVAMFFIELVASFGANSMALRADALDFLGDSFTYAITLIAIGFSLKWRASVAMFKGITLAIMGIWVLGSTIYRMFVLDVPDEAIMGIVAILAFIANAVSAILLVKYKEGDANVRSVWLCSRNDAIGNFAVLMAALVVYFTHSNIPDLVVAGLMASLFLHSSLMVIRQSFKEFQAIPKEH